MEDKIIIYDEQIKIGDVEIPKGVIRLQEYAFAHDPSLEKVKLPESLEVISEGAFKCTNLKEILIPNSVRIIGSSAFAYCDFLEKVELSNSLEFIGKSAFERSGLTSLKIPKNVKEISYQAFGHCKKLQVVEFLGGETEIYESAFTNTSINKLILHEPNMKVTIRAFNEADIKVVECSKEFHKKVEELEYTSLHYAYDFLKKSDLDGGYPNFSLVLHYENFNQLIKEYTTKSTKIVEDSNTVRKKTRFLILSFVGPKLTFFQKQKFKEILSKIGICNKIRFEKEPLATEVNKKETKENAPSILYPPDEVVEKINKIDAILENYPMTLKPLIIKKRDNLVLKYKKRLEQEKTTLDFSNTVEIKLVTDTEVYSKKRFLVELEELFRILSYLRDFLSQLDTYYQILENPVTKEIENPLTNEELLTNLVFLLTNLEEKKKKEVESEIRNCLEFIKELCVQTLEKGVDFTNFNDLLNQKLKPLYEKTIKYFINTKPFLELKQSFITPATEYLEDNRVESLILNFNLLKEQIVHIQNKEILSASFLEIRNKYESIIDHVINTEEFSEETYLKIVGHLRKDMTPLLEYLHVLVVLEENHIPLKEEVKSDQKMIEVGEEKSSSNGSILHSFIQDIRQKMEEIQLTEEEKEKTFLAISNTLKKFLKTSACPSLKEQKTVEQELYKDLESILLTLINYSEKKQDESILHYLKPYNRNKGN